MAYITERNQAKKIIEDACSKGMSIAMLCTGSFWNTEAILRAASNVAKRYGIENIPVAIAMTYNYAHMQQAQRITRCRDAKTGFIAIMNYCRLLCEGDDAPYKNVTVLPHLDHGDPDLDVWAMTEGTKYLASVMFDCQKYDLQKNLELTTDYVKRYSREVLVEGVVEGLGVGGSDGAKKARQNENYVETAVDYVKKTGVDFLVADLGTEQQSDATTAHYLKDRAQNLTKSLGRPMLVLHGTSSLKNEDIQGFAADGVVRVNMWTRIVRESCQYAARKLIGRKDKIEAGDFSATESMQYMYDCVDEGTRIMEMIMDSLGYANLAK